jgi:hypothetical protein
MAMTMAVDPVAAARYFVQQLGCTAFPVWGSTDGRCSCGDPHDGKTGKHGPDNVGKHPATQHGFKEGTTDVDAIKKFLSNPGTPNYGLTAPPGVLVIDVDGPEGLASWDQLQHRHGPLPVTLTTTTANGRHYFYRWPEGAGPMPTGKLFGFVVRRSDDGYVIGPGSVHPKGVVYDTLRREDGHPYAIADLPRGWAEAARQPDPVASSTIHISGRPDPATVAVGGRHDFLRDTARFYAGTIRDPAALEAAVWAINLQLSEPKTEADVRRAIGEALTKYPADPVETDPETGEVRVVRGDGDARGILGAPDSGQFPQPPSRAAFGGLVGELVAELATGTDASEVAMLGSLLAFLGVLYPATGHFGRSQSTALFVGLVGPSTEGRKGTAMERAEVAVSQCIGQSVVANIMFDGVNSGEGLVSALETRQKMFRNEPVSGLMYEEEFATLLAAQSRDNSTLDPRMRAAWDGKALSNRKQASQQSIEPPYWVGALVSITPKELRDRAPRGAFTSGSFNRWLWLPVIRRDIEVLDTPPDVPYQLRTRLSDSFHAAQQERPFLRHTVEAQRMLADYSAHLLRAAVGMERDLSARLVPIALRVGMVHAMVEGQREVTRDHVARGIALTDYARSGIHWVFGMSAGDPITTLLLRTLMEDEAGVITKHQITQDITRDPVKRQQAIDNLMDAGLVEKVTVKTGGRPRQEVRLLPSRGAFVPFVQISASQPNPKSPADGLHGSAESHETQITHETHESVGKGGWLSPCRDYDRHQRQHRQLPAGWLCDACEADSPSGICPVCGVGPFLSVEYFDRHQVQAHGR